MVNINSGTLVASDLQFLRTIKKGKPDVPLYIILNRADQRSLVACKEIFDEVSDVLNNAGIQYYGISAYSSSLGKEYIHSKNESLQSFLKKLNHPQPKLDNIIAKIYAIDEKYQRAILRSICVNERYIDALCDTVLRLENDNYAQGPSKIYDCLEDILDQFHKINKELVVHLKALENVTTKFVDSVIRIFNSNTENNVEVITHLKRQIINTNDIDTSDIKITQVIEKEKQLADELISEIMKISDNDDSLRGRLFSEINSLLNSLKPGIDLGAFCISNNLGVKNLFSKLWGKSQHPDEVNKMDNDKNIALDLLKTYQDYINANSSLSLNLFIDFVKEKLP